MLHEIDCRALSQLRRFVHLLLLTSERAWAHAMHMKATHSADSGVQGITGSTKRHINSRLHKASVCAGVLVDLLQYKEVSKASADTILEARAYYVSLRGTIYFEKQNWQDCLHEFSEARLIYTVLTQSRGLKREDLFHELLNDTIEPSIRYAAYQIKLPRTTSIDSIVSRYVPRVDNEFVKEIFERYPGSLDDPADGQKKTVNGTTENVPKTIQWRSRVVNLEDAATAQALAAVSAAVGNLSSFLSSNPDAAPQAKASAYDEVLIPSQDAVDATKTAIDELSVEGVSQSDRRMQALQITRTAVNYALVGWRVGRNRVLCGQMDGAILEAETLCQPKKFRKDSKTKSTQEQSTGRKLNQLRERVVLYDATIQSLDSVKELPGVAADQEFVKSLETKRSYFTALRCLAIARSHVILRDTKNALALVARALDHSTLNLQHTNSSQTPANQPPNIDISLSQAKSLNDLVQGLVLRHRALAELYNLNFANSNKAKPAAVAPLINNLHEYPQHMVDLTNLVTYPPKIEPIPVKPLFLDVAFNYIDYPGRTRTVEEKAVNRSADEAAIKEEKKEGRKGWFGFGR